MNLTRRMRYRDDLSVIQLLVRRMGHLEKGRLAEYYLVCVGLLILSPKTAPNVSVYRPDSLFQEQLGV